MSDPPASGNLAIGPAILDAVGTPLAIADLDGTVRLANRSCLALLGRTRAEVVGLPLWESLVAGEHCAAARAVVADLAAEAAAKSDRPSGQAATVETAATTAGDKPIEAAPPATRAIVAWSATLAQDGAGGQCIVLTATEPHRRRRALHALAETEGRYEALLNLSPDSIIVHQDWQIVFANESAARLLGAASPDELLGRNPLDVVGPASRDLVRGRIEHLLAHGGVVPLVEQQHRRLDGTLIDVEVAAAAVTYAGRPAVEYIARDIRERKRAQAALHESEARVRAIFDESSIGMMLIDSEGRCVATNRAVRTLLGYTGEELAAMRVRDFIHPDEQATTGELLRDFFAGRTGAISVQKRYVRKDGSVFWALLNASPVHDRDGRVRYSASILEDISARLALEDQLLQASKMEAIGRLAGGVAHDMNNLLTAIIGFGRLALAGAEPGSALGADIGEVLNAADRAAALTSQLLAFGRRQVMRPRAVDLAEVVHGVVPMLGRLIGEDVTLDVRAPSTGDRVFADPGSLEQILVNLAVNARDAMPDGGSLSIETAHVDLDESFATAHVGTVAGPYVRLVVADTGFGMDPEVLDHIFEPFYTTKAPGRGTGLGLSSVFGIVQQLDGAIYATSSPGRGAAFSIYLPCTDARAEPVRTVPARVRPTGGPETILVAEDEPAVRDLCARILGENGYRVLAAASGEAALEVARTAGSVDLLFTDMVMTGMNGAELARDVVALHPGCRTLFASGYSDDVVAQRGAQAPGTAFLAKPYQADDLLARVRAVLDRGRGAPDAAAAE